MQTVKKAFILKELFPLKEVYWDYALFKRGRLIFFKPPYIALFTLIISLNVLI